MGKPYSQELDAFPATYEWASRQPVRNLRCFLERWSGEHVAVVGSGGSFSAARVVALFRECAHHSVTTAHTPLELISLLDRLSPRVLFLSAEGKNKDILAALSASANADVAALAVTLSADSPLAEVARAVGAPRVFQYPMDWIKDGYLATNSLLATTFLLYRAFFSDTDFKNNIGPLFSEDRLRSRRKAFVRYCKLAEPRPGSLLVLHSSAATSFAVDLASKVAEAALFPVQTTDLRQFAHGQHLQLASPLLSPQVVVAYSKAEQGLADATIALLPKGVEATRLEIDGEEMQDVAVAGLLDAMLLTEALAANAGYDIGQPDVPEFGRAIHQMDPRPFLPDNTDDVSLVARASRRKMLAGKRVANDLTERVEKAAADYLKRLTSASIRAVVCDFDGTLCRTEDRFDPLGQVLAKLLEDLARSGLKVAIATGRGDSLRDSIVPSINAELLPYITVGYYSGALITSLENKIESPPGNQEFDELSKWLDSTVYARSAGSPRAKARLGQLTIHVVGQGQATKLLNAVRAWLRNTSRTNWRAYCSGHSVDVLDGNTSKCRVVEHMATLYGLNPVTEILRIGDSGHEEGNDFELLKEGLSLSCDNVSADLDSCWNFSQKGNNQAESTISYLRSLVPSNGSFRFLESALVAHDAAVRP